nr:reverse transcriptase domain-containing protein [Tanacetum cinerariifolium]
MPKKGGMTVVANENNELIPTSLVTGWSVCIDYRKLNDATRKDHFLLPFMDQMLERLAENELYCFLDGFSGYFQIPIDPQDQEKITFTCPYGTFAYRRMPFGLCKAPDVIDIACEEFVQDVLDFQYNSKCSNPTLVSNPSFSEETNSKFTVQSQRRVNLKIHDVIKKEVIKLLDAGMIYPISDSPWVSPIHCVPKKGGMTVVANENNELIPTSLVTGWSVCIDYRKLNDASRKDHFLLPFMDQMLERLAENEFYCFLDGFSGYFQIPIDPQDQEKITFTCPYGTFAYRRMPFGLCKAPGTFQKCMIAIFHDMIEKTLEVFMDDFSVFGDSFCSCLSNLDKMLKRYEDTNLVLN